MILRGSILKGLNFIGRPSLSSIGNLVYHFDYRFANVIQDYSGVNRITEWTSLTGDANLTRSTTSTARPRTYVDGFGSDFGVNENNNLFTNAILFDKYLPLHDSTPHMIWSVQYYDNPSNVSSGTEIIKTIPTVGGQAGFRLTILPANNQMRHEFASNAGALQAYTSPSNSLPETQVSIFVCILYGTGSNNWKTIINSTSYTATRSPTWGTNNPIILQLLTKSAAANSPNIRLKSTGAYNLSGKSVSEIDSLVTTFYSVLKSDLEYASLTTP
jgi:hypothetical protein